ncbi:MAG: tRNA epoxyqueuosine(34) reductase QueG [SAR324 cluster bacterium]|nr:tRNA epoxyqueuosine(34) reductase QueG [SAR324 cluster bacterium]
MTLTQQIKKKALDLGFDLVSIIPVSPSTTIDVYANWLASGYAGEMSYLEKHYERKKDLQNVMPQTRSLISLAINYYTKHVFEAEKKDPSKGLFSSYAWGDDYHQIVREKLEQLRAFIQERMPVQGDSRVYVDTGPILEREYAVRGGLGWFGKNSMLINRQKGSWFFLAEILLSNVLEYDPVIVKEGCGSCTLCLDACPTNAIVLDGLVDARRCLSYLTIELKGSIPQEFRQAMGNIIFGCDICQDVCPWNIKATVSQVSAFRSRGENNMPNLIDLMSLSQTEFSRRFKNSPVKRSKRRGFLRNVAIALGNWGSPQAIPALKHGLSDEEPLIKIHSAWALGQISHPEAKQVLKAALEVEKEEEVIREIKEALFVV